MLITGSAAIAYLIVAVASALTLYYFVRAWETINKSDYSMILRDYVGIEYETIIMKRLEEELTKGESETDWETALADALGLTVTVVASTITIGNVNYKCDTDAQVIVAEMERQKHQYYPAILSNGTVWVAPIPISRKEAIAIMMLDNEFIGVFALSNQYARGLCGSLGGARGPEKHGLKGGYWYHFHGNRYPDAHCWYIGY